MRARDAPPSAQYSSRATCSNAASSLVIGPRVAPAHMRPVELSWSSLSGLPDGAGAIGAERQRVGRLRLPPEGERPAQIVPHPIALGELAETPVVLDEPQHARELAD